MCCRFLKRVAGMPPGSGWRGLPAVPFFLITGLALGQEVLVPSAPPPARPSGYTPAGAPREARDAIRAPFEARGDDAGLLPPLRWGPFQAHPSLGYQLLRGTGFLGSADRSEESTLHSITPGLEVNIGKLWVFNYSAVFRVYESEQRQDVINHHLELSGLLGTPEWPMIFKHSTSLISDPVIETGVQTEHDIHQTSWSTIHAINSRYSFELSANQYLRISPEFANAYTWSSLNWLNYAWTPFLTTAAGVGGGYTILGEDPVRNRPEVHMAFEHLQGRVSWSPSTKLAIQITGGVEMRQTLDTLGADRLTPIYGLSLSYHLFEQTFLSAGATRSVAPSYFGAETVDVTNVHGGVRQRLLGKLYLDLNAGYRLSDYQAVVGPSGLVVRSDEGGYFRARLSTFLLKTSSVGIFYFQTENTSSRSGFAVNSHQYGLDLHMRF